MADNIFYRDTFVKCNVIADDNGLRLDLPFQIYHQTVVENGNNHYCYLDSNLKDKEVIAYIHYAIKDEDKVKSFIGYLGNDWTEVQKNTDVVKNWTVKKEDALATTENELTVKYDKVDKLDIIHPYMAEDIALKK